MIIFSFHFSLQQNQYASNNSYRSHYNGCPSASQSGPLPSLHQLQPSLVPLASSALYSSPSLYHTMSQSPSLPPVTPGVTTIQPVKIEEAGENSCCSTGSEASRMATDSPKLTESTSMRFVLREKKIQNSCPNWDYQPGKGFCWIIYIFLICRFPSHSSRCNPEYTPLGHMSSPNFSPSSQPLGSITYQQLNSMPQHRSDSTSDHPAYTDLNKSGESIKALSYVSSIIQLSTII